MFKLNLKCLLIYSFLPSTGHYTQMVWAKTSKIGCGSISWQEGRFIKQFLVCNYGPSGNFLRAPMYEIGQACSRCPSGTSCSNGLCSGSSSSSGPSASFPVINPPTPSQPIFTVNVEPSRPSPTRRPSRPIISPAPVFEFGFIPMTDSIQVQDPRPAPRPALATIEPVNNDISVVQNLLQPIPQGNPPPPELLLQVQQQTSFRPRPSSPRPQQPLRRPNCRGMFAFMCNLFG